MGVANQRRFFSLITSYSHTLTHGGMIAIMFVVALAAPLAAGKFNKAVSAGDVGKPFFNLIGTDEKLHSLDDYLKDGKAVVLLFTCNHCPVAAGYEDRLFAMHKEFAPQGVRFVAISCGLNEADGFEAMKKRAVERKFPFPYLHDPAQETGRDYGARVTPEVFVLKADRTIVYLGTIDDSWNDADAVKHAYLREALTAVVAGRTPETVETRPRGCPIDYVEP